VVLKAHVQLLITITGWSVALICYISDSAKQRKIADFDPSGSRNLAWLTTPGTPPHMTTLVGVVQRGWSGHIRDLSRLFLFFSFFFSFFALFKRAQVAFLDRSKWSIRQNACFRPGMCLLESPQYPTTFRGQTPKIFAKMGLSRHFAAKSAK